jgi:hypothetical protein
MKTHWSISTAVIRPTLSAMFAASSLIAMPSFGQGMPMAIEHASICKASGSDPATNQLSTYDGVFNNNKWDVAVTCPIVRTAAVGAGGMGVWVNGRTGATGSMNCTLTSLEYDGSVLYTSSFTVGTHNASFRDGFNVPSWAVPFYSSQHVTCNLPTQSGLYSIEAFIPI